MARRRITSLRPTTAKLRNPRAAKVKPLTKPKTSPARPPAAPAGPPVPPALAPLIAALTAQARSTQPQGLGVDPNYDAMLASATRNRDTALQQNEAARAQLGQTYGFRVGEGGSVMDDPTNPFSRAAALATAYRQRTQGSTTSYAARGQLYAGSLQNAHNANQEWNLRSRDALIRDFMNARTRLSNADVLAQNAFADAASAAEADRVQRALAARDEVVPNADLLAALMPSAQDQASAANGGAPKITQNYKSPSGKRGTLKVYPNGRKVFIPY